MTGTISSLGKCAAEIGIFGDSGDFVEEPEESNDFAEPIVIADLPSNLRTDEDGAGSRDPVEHPKTFWAVTSQPKTVRLAGSQN